jgi:hypothetical protein
MPSLDVFHSVSADGRTVAEAVVDTAAQAAELVAAGRAGRVDTVWAHSNADLAPLGFRQERGYRRLTGPARPRPEQNPDQYPAQHPGQADIGPISEDEDSAALCAATFSGQWGHKTPDTWPLDRAPGTRTLGLRRAGTVVGVCRLVPATGQVDAPGLIAAYRRAPEYRTLLTAALAGVATDSVTVESWETRPIGCGSASSSACRRRSTARAGNSTWPAPRELAHLTTRINRVTAARRRRGELARRWSAAAREHDAESPDRQQ